MSRTAGFSRVEGLRTLFARLWFLLGFRWQKAFDELVVFRALRSYRHLLRLFRIQKSSNKAKKKRTRLSHKNPKL